MSQNEFIYIEPIIFEKQIEKILISIYTWNFQDKDQSFWNAGWWGEYVWSSNHLFDSKIHKLIIDHTHKSN